VKVYGLGFSTVSDSHGIVTLTPAHSGILILHATKHAYIRAAALNVRVK
jgi:hypothetical protein